jgi:hypothetical protein
VSSGPSNLRDLANDLLLALAVYYGEQGVELPETQYLNGKGTAPVAMCDSLVVGWSRVFFGAPGGLSMEGRDVRLQQLSRQADLNVWVFRCVSTFGDGPNVPFDPSAEAADALTVMTDAYLLPKAIMAAKFSGSLGDYCTGLSVGDCRPIEPNGGIAGTVIDLTVELS